MRTAQPYGTLACPPYTEVNIRKLAPTTASAEIGWEPVSRPATARRILVTGRQGSGKGTQCQALSLRLAIPHISAGEALRRAAHAGSGFGREIASTMAAGKPVADELVASAVSDHIDDAMSSGFVLDGFPRTVKQAKILCRMLGTARVELAIRISIPVDRIVERMSRRRVCIACGVDQFGAVPGQICGRCGNDVAPRQDDTPEAIRARLAIYDKNEPALAAWLANHTRFVTVDGDGTPEQVSNRIWAAARSHPSGMAIPLPRLTRHGA